MQLRERLYSTDTFLTFVNSPEQEGRRFELDDGVIVEMGSSSRLNTVTTTRIIHFLTAYAIEHEAGYVTAPDGGFILAEGRVRRPDAAFISKRHGLRLEGVEFTVAPDLAVEVVSPDEDVFRKAREYFQAGTRMVWAVYAADRLVYVMRLNGDGGILSLPFADGDILDGGDVLPGFQVPVKALFPD